MSTNESQPPERDPEVLEMYIEESLEGLARMEKLLLEAEQGQAPEDLLSRLFRDIHTIKGTSGFLALTRTATLAHAAEDLLALLRDRPQSATAAHYGKMVEVLDLLRHVTEAVRDRKDEPDVDVGTLISALQRSVAQLDAPQLSSTTALPASADPAAPVDRQEPASRRAGESSDGTVRVNVAVLDRLMNLMGELVLARNQILQLTKSLKDAQLQGHGAFQRLSVVTSELQEQIMKTRMQPVARVFEKIPRHIRDLSQQTGKRVTCQIQGTATEIDKALVEAIRDPVMHAVRNAVDHGIEEPEKREAAGKPPTGTLTVSASHEGGKVTIEIADDGRGMEPQRLREHAIRRGIIGAAEAERLSDREALELVFRPGFSTAAAVTNISGRGVGMDVVRTHVERAGGQVELESQVGKGTTLRLKMPLTLAIIPALLVEARGERFAIPQVNLTELVYLTEEQLAKAVEYVRGAPIYRLRGEVLPLVRLGDVLRLPQPARTSDLGVHIVVVAVGTRRYGLLVDAIHDTEEIVIKPLSGHLKRLACYAGATVLGDGCVSLIVDVAGVAEMAGIEVNSRAQPAATHSGQAEAMQSLLCFTIGQGNPCAVPLGMVARLERIRSSSIERLGGGEVVQYRGSIMPIIRPEGLLGLTRQPAGEEQPLLVFDFGAPVGMAVEQILDVVEIEVGSTPPRADRPYTLGQLVSFGRSTLLLDVYAMLREVVPHFAQERSATRSARVLLVDDCNAMRAATATFLRSQGLTVVESHCGEAALQELRRSQRAFQAMVTDLEMTGMSGFQLLERVRAEIPTLPAVAWTFHEDPEVQERARASGARSCIHKGQREGLVRALQQFGVLAPRALDEGRAA